MLGQAKPPVPPSELTDCAPADGPFALDPLGCKCNEKCIRRLWRRVTTLAPALPPKCSTSTAAHDQSRRAGEPTLQHPGYP